MKGKPQVGTPSYSQGWGPEVDFTDRGQVDQMGQTAYVPMGSYEDVLVIAEGSKAEPDAYQLKYFARGVGNVLVGWRGEGEKKQEILKLVDFMQLGPEAMAEIRAKVLALEKRAYEISKDVYGQTQPAEHTPGPSSGFSSGGNGAHQNQGHGGRGFTSMVEAQSWISFLGTKPKDGRKASPRRTVIKLMSSKSFGYSTLIPNADLLPSKSKPSASLALLSRLQTLIPKFFSLRNSDVR